MSLILNCNKTEPVTLSDETLERNVLILGSAGSGKPLFLLDLAKQQLRRGAPLLLFDFLYDLSMREALESEYVEIQSASLGENPVSDIHGIDFSRPVALFVDRMSQHFQGLKMGLQVVFDVALRSQRGNANGTGLICLDEYHLVEDDIGERLTPHLVMSRKNHCGYVFSCQRLPNPCVVGNVGTFFVFRTSDDRILQYLSEIRCLSDSEISNIQDLRCGEALVIHANGDRRFLRMAAVAFV